jgi:hypothetical protein
MRKGKRNSRWKTLSPVCNTATTATEPPNTLLAQAMRQIQTNLDSIEKQMAEVDGNIDQLEDQERDKVLSLIADVVTIIFATGTLLFAIGVLGPMGAAIN